MNERIKLVRTTTVDEDGKKLTQDRFATELGVSKNYICQLETGTRAASDNLIKLICVKYGVNEEWLRTGEGEMHIQLTEDEELEEWIGRIQFKAIQGDKVAKIKKRLLTALKKIEHDETWEDLNRVINEIAAKNREDQE